MTIADVIDRVKESPQNKVKIAISDIDGVLRGKYIHKDKFLSSVESGIGFCNVVFGWDCNDSCYKAFQHADTTQYTGWHTGYPDALATIDLSTFRTVPWDENVPFFLADFSKDKNNTNDLCPRTLVKKIVDRLNSMNLSASVAFEFEWFNFRESSEDIRLKKYSELRPITPGMFGYSILRSTHGQPYFRTLFEKLEEFKIPLEGLHTETGPGVYEAAICRSDPLETADRAVLFKSAVKEIAYPFGIIPTFMAKWNSALPGCGGHLHQSLWDNAQQKNLFYDEKAQDNISETCRSYIAGQLHCLPKILPLLAPNINSYKRFIEGYWAPTTATWGIDNRTAAIRAIPGSKNSTRLEMRVCGADINPYLALAASLASGLYGVERKLKLETQQIRGDATAYKNCEKLPNTLLAASEQFYQSEISRELFGEKFVEHFYQSRIWEWEQARSAVTNWELERYFEII